MREAPSSRSKSPSRARFVTCHICGRDFGTASLEIHQRSCRKKWEQEEEAKPAHLRRPVPEAPVAAPVGSQAYNDAAFEKYNAEALVPCERCGRTFLPNPLEIHLRSCKGPRVKDDAGQRAAPASANGLR